MNKAPNVMDITMLKDLYATDENGQPLVMRPPFDPRSRNTYHAGTASKYVFWFATCSYEASLVIEGQPWVSGQYCPLEVTPLGEGRSSVVANCVTENYAGDSAAHSYILSASLTKNTSTVPVKLMMMPQDGECRYSEKSAWNDTAWGYNCSTGQMKAHLIAMFDDDDVEVLLRHHHTVGGSAPQKHRLYLS